MKISLAALSALALAAAGCAHDVHARFPQPTPDEATGTVELVFGAPSPQVSVAVNGVMVVRGARTEHVTITGVPTGYADLAIAAGPGEKQLRVWVEADHTTSVPLPAPGEAPSSAIRNFALSVATVAIYALLR